MPQNLLAEKSVQLKKENDHLEGTICIDLETVRLWDNHDPYLYHAYVELKAEDGSLVEVIPYDIGFGRIEIIDKIIYLNGKRLVITGVNRHEWNPKTGRCIGLEDMRADIACMLRNNINSVRTCHYPDQIPWYYMCDNAGIQTGNLPALLLLEESKEGLRSRQRELLLSDRAAQRPQQLRRVPWLC